MENTNKRGAYIALSILIAIVLWVYVGYINSNEDTYTIRNVPVVFTGEEELAERGLMITEGANQTINLSVRTTWSTLLKLGSSTMSVSVDVSGIENPGTYSTGYRIVLPVGVSNNAVSITGSTAQNIAYTVARRTQRSIEVKGIFDGDVADGFQQGEFAFSPSTILVDGEEDAVNQVDYALVTISRDEPLSETFTGEMPFQLIGFDGQVLDVKSLNLETDVSTVQVTLPVVKLKEVELKVDLLPGGGATADNAEVDIEPSTITISGSEEDLATKDEIVLGQIDLSQVFSQNTYTFDIPLEAGLNNVSGITQAKVTVKITGLATRTLEVDNIQFINYPEGCTPEKVTLSCQVQIRGEQEAVDAVIPSQLRIVADLSNAGRGNQTVDAKVYLDGSSNVGVVGEYKIVVNVQRN
ncbi:hypothetical protein B5G43_03795 [Flavonifractor sp. An92]|uniref:CdaR family protein n=1 Tax=Flavonifractor sp. An92 TaxID=1965666 RepID=UPI000B38AE1E|nr:MULTISPECIES: hypothetical protein [unclassified Flavonifractor]OUN07944.1 hypothetical protein B5G43_03795 [Flavonifractor sp. An92]OUQ24724.1 hypothetical protein B5E80_06380 [Flavonifractor sp. An135]